MVAAKISLWSHAQTVTAALPLRRALPRNVAHEVVELAIPEGGALIAPCSWQSRRAPAIIVLHGVAGSSEDAYVVRASRELVHAGFHVMRLNQRGSGLGRGRANRLYHAGMVEDVELAARHLASRHDVTGIGALGFSLGGHLALAHAADAGEGAVVTPLSAVATISAPVDLAATMRMLDAGRRGLVGLYEALMVRSLVDKARALRERLGDRAPFSEEDVRRIRSIRTFDDVVTVPANGFRDEADYHARASVGPRLRAIRAPTLMLHAADDPIVPASALTELSASDSVVVEMSSSGGHVGFVREVAQLWGATSAVARATAHLMRHLRNT